MKMKRLMIQRSSGPTNGLTGVCIQITEFLEKIERKFNTYTI